MGAVGGHWGPTQNGNCKLLPNPNVEKDTALSPKDFSRSSLNLYIYFSLWLESRLITAAWSTLPQQLELSAYGFRAPYRHSIARLSLVAIPSVNVHEALTALLVSFPKLQKTLAVSTSHLTPYWVIKPVDPNICGPQGSVFTLTALTTSLKSINTVARVIGVFGVPILFSSIPGGPIDFAAP